MIRLLSCEAEGKLQLTHRRSVLRCARQGSLTLRTLERVLARSALWHAQESADALVEFCRSLLFNFAFPSAHATSLILPYERPAMFPAKLATTFATWARALLPAVIVNTTSPDALRSRLLTLLLSAVLTTPERTRPLGPQQDQGFAVLSADILQRVASASPQLLLPHCDALRRLLFVHVHRLPPETIPSLCSVFHQLGAVSPRVRDSYVLSVQAILLTFRRDHQGLGCIIANLLLGSGRLAAVEAKTLCDCATRALALSWPVMEHRAKSVLLRSLAHNLHHFDEESRAQIGRQFLIPHLQTLNILPAETRPPSAATDIGRSIGSGRGKESATATILSLSEIAGEPRATSSLPPSVVFSIAAYLQADHAGLQDIVAHLLDAAEEAKDEGKDEEDQRRRQRWVALVDRLQHLTEVLPTYLALLQTASVEAEQAADKLSIGFAMPVRFAELFKAATADDDDGGEASAAALFPPNEKGGRQARVGQIVRLALASLVGCLLCSSMLSLPRSAAGVSRLAHMPGEWLMARIGFERALAKSAEELRAACQSEEEDEEEEEEACNDEPPPQPRPQSLPLSLPRRSKRPASPSGLQVRASPSPSRSPSRSPSLSASTAAPRQIFVADDDDDDGIVLLKVEPDEEKDCADELPAILTCRPPALTRPRPHTKAETESARPKKRVRIAVRPEDLETGDDELQNDTDESPAGVRPRRTGRLSAADSIDVVVAPRRETVGPSLAHGCAIKQEADRVTPKSEEQPPTRDPQPAVAFIVTLRELYEDVIPHLDLSTCVELLKSVAHLPSCTDLTARLALFILHGLTRARAAPPEGPCGGGVSASVEDAGQQLVPFLLGLTRTLSDEVHHLRLEVSHLYRRETINKRESDRAGQREIGTTLDAWKAKMDTLATLYQILEHLFRHPTTTPSSSSSSSSSSLLASCCAYFDTPNARPVEVLESLYAHFTKLFTQCQNFFLAGLVVKVLLALTRGFRKRKYIAFPIYRALSSVYPSMHFLPSFPRSLALGRLPPLPEKWLSGAAVQESDGAVPFCVYVAFLLRSLSSLLPHSKYFLCARELTFALIDFLCTRELEYHHVFASMHQRSVPTILSGVLVPVSGHCASLLVTAERAQVLSSSGGICSLTLDYLSLVRRLVAAFALAQRAGYPIRVQTVLAACKRVFAALEHCMRSLLAAVASPAGEDDEEEEERLPPPPADPPSQHQGEALSFLSQLASYGQGLLEEVLVIDLKSPKALKQSVGLRSVAEKMREFLSDVKSACGPGIETATSAGREDLTRPHHDRHHSRARNADDDDDDEEEEEELLSSEDDEDEAEDEGTTGFPFTLRRRGDPAEEWGLPGEANDPRRASGSCFDGLDDRDGDHDDPDDHDDDDPSLDEDASFEVYGEDELCDSEDDEEEDDDQGSGGADSNDNDLYEYDPLLTVLDDHKPAAGASDDANGDDEFRVVFHK